MNTADAPAGAALPQRCRLVVFAPPVEALDRLLAEALAGGDVASVILMPGELDEAEFQRHCAPLLAPIQAAGAAALVGQHSRIAGRLEADGLYLEGRGHDFAGAVARFSPHASVGFGDVRDRQGALELGELQPDFVLFGRSDGDIRPEPHPKNLALAQWWAEMVEISCVVMAGSDIDSVVECAATGAEFVAAGLAVLAHVEGPRAAVAHANALLDEHAPVFDED